MEYLSENTIIKFITFIGVVALAHQKRYYHWLYLKDIDPSVKGYDKEDDFYNAKGLDGNLLNPLSQLSTMGLLLIPFFRVKKDDKPSEMGKIYANRIRQMLVLTYLGIATLVVEFIYMD